jgi:hypothetical protein
MTSPNPTPEETLKNLNTAWQEYLAKTATDPAAQQNLQTLMQYWTTLAAGGISGYAPPHAAAPFATPYSTPPAAAASYASSQQLFELASRLSLVEGRLAALEHALHSTPKSSA